MKTLFTAEAVSEGARSGSVSSPDGLLNFKLGNPLEPGLETRGPNPELLFAGAYSACYHGALLNAAKNLGHPTEGSTVRALVAVELHAQLPNVTREQAEDIMAAAHKTCPYSKALRGEAKVTLVVD
jgi:osmotically inducible protein OsmC